MMNPGNSIFRERSMARLSSPEQLDQLMKITSSRGWLMLVAVFMFLAVAIAWSIFGRISTKVAGEGILIKGGSVLDVVSVGAGQISALYVEAGQDVHRGQIIARIGQPELVHRIEKAKARLDELREQRVRIAELETEDSRARANYASGQRATLGASMSAERSRISFLQDKLRKQQRLLRQGLVTKSSVEATRQEMRQARASLKDASAQLRSLSVQKQASKGEKARAKLAGDLQISEMEREIELLSERLELTSRVISAHDGRVLEVRVAVGDVVNLGQSLATLEPKGSEGSGLVAMIYVPVGQGKSLRPGMRAQISPASVNQEEHGVTLGIVTRVSEFPSTQAGMKRVLQNDQLVQQLLRKVGLAPIAVRAELIPDARTVSGYKWSTESGPPLVLGPGTPCRTTITVQRTRPIVMVIPMLRQVLGV